MNQIQRKAKRLVYFYSIIQMQDSKENEFGNFSKLLKKLEYENVGLPELRQLKQQHAYLEKLRQQRTKIEQLKSKYDSIEAQLEAEREENNSQRHLIEDQHRTIQLLEEKVAESEKKRSQLETGVNRTLEIERERHRIKNNEISLELEEVKKESKAKDIAIFEMEDQLERRTLQFKEQLQIDRKRINAEWEQKYRCLISEKASKDHQVEELRELVTRQHKALQLQNEEYEDIAKKNEDLSEALAELEEQLNEAIRQRAQSDERVADLTELAGRMEAELEERRNGASAKEQVEELRKKVNELAKGELERIQFIVNEFE